MFRRSILKYLMSSKKQKHVQTPYRKITDDPRLQTNTKIQPQNNQTYYPPHNPDAPIENTMDWYEKPLSYLFMLLFVGIGIFAYKNLKPIDQVLKQMQQQKRQANAQTKLQRKPQITFQKSTDIAALNLFKELSTQPQKKE